MTKWLDALNKAKEAQMIKSITRDVVAMAVHQIFGKALLMMLILI